MRTPSIIHRRLTPNSWVYVEVSASKEVNRVTQGKKKLFKYQFVHEDVSLAIHNLLHHDVAEAATLFSLPCIV